MNVVRKERKTWITFCVVSFINQIYMISHILYLFRRAKGLWLAKKIDSCAGKKEDLFQPLLYTQFHTTHPIWQNIIKSRLFPLFKPRLPFFLLISHACLAASSETQGQSVRSGGKAGRKFSSKSERAPGHRLSPDHFQKFKPMPAPDWAQKMLCVIVPNRRTHLNEFFSCVRTWRLLSRSRLV